VREMRGDLVGPRHSVPVARRVEGRPAPDDRDEPPAEERLHDVAEVVLWSRGHRGGRFEAALLSQDRAVALLERRARLDPELVVERAPRVVVDVERLRLPPGAVEG